MFSKNLFLASLCTLILTTKLTLSAEPQGWDSGIQKKCYIGMGGSTELQDWTPFYNSSQCDPGIHTTYWDTMNPSKSWNGLFWMVGFQSEQTYETTTACGRFNLADPNGPAQVHWTPRADGKGWEVRLFTNLNTVEHPCGPNYFNWLVFMDQNVNRGPGGLEDPNAPALYPSPIDLSHMTKVWFDRFINGQNGAIRLSFGWKGLWKSMGPNGTPIEKIREIEISNLSNWGDAHPDQRIITLLDRPQTETAQALDYVHADASAYGITVPLAIESSQNIDWSNIIIDMVNSGYLDAPLNWSEVKTTGVWLGTEVNNITVTNSAVSNLYIRDFKIQTKHHIPVGATASSTSIGSSPLNSIDNEGATSWNSGQNSTPRNRPWIQIDLGAPKKLSKLLLLPQQSPDGPVSHEIYGGSTPTQLRPLGVVNGSGRDNFWLTWKPAQPISNIRYIRVRTISSPSWVAWRWIRAYGE